MAQKWNLQDIVPPDKRKQAPPPKERRSDIGVAPRQRSAAKMDAVREPAAPAAPAEAVVVPGVGDQFDNVDSVVARLEVQDGRLARLRRYILGGVMIAVILGVGLAITVVLSGAEVTIRPKSHQTTVQATFTTKIKPGIGELGYELLTLEEEGERQVAATGKQDVKAQAKGQITVYNAFSTTPQRLIKNTRFESPNGLIYRISNSIVIPGYKKDAGGTAVPGSVVTDVFADSTGEVYNVAEARFNVPGLKDTEQYGKIYAETAKDGITGGFEGTKFVIDEGELATTKQKLHTELRDKLLSRIQTERPNGFVVFDPSITFSYDSLPSEEGTGETAIIKERARLMVPLFREADFAAYLAQNTITGYDKAPVRIEDQKSLTFSYDPPLTTDIGTAESLQFKLSGPMRIVWQIDQEMIKKELLGISKSDAPKVFSKYSSIDKAETVVRPIWKTSFPTSEDDIKVIESAPGG